MQKLPDLIKRVENLLCISSPFFVYSLTSMAQTSSVPWKFIQDMGSLSHYGLIIALGQEANSDNLGKFYDFLHNNCMLSALIRTAMVRQF